ncbi:MAG: Asp-tRNA(Asn)/Glu-tRNA(Gln) amidotransferase subunit GatC [Actinomycetia bacterium]|nr:Asp-tRNA(Asn)/Glu-tRNA(Gln) amidotransferase subunit GatC [Actinomycetes bacterium]
MALTTEETKHVAMLARIGLSDQEIETLKNELNDVFAHIDSFKELDLDGVVETIHPIEVKNVMRDDVIAPPLGVEAAMKNAPAHEGSAFLVPRIVAVGGDAS